MQRLDCYDQAYIKSQPDFNHSALLYQFDAANKTAAAEYADGKISQVQFKVALAHNFADLQQATENANGADFQATQQYNAQQQQVQAQQDADQAARWQNFWGGGIQNYANQQQAIQNANRPPPPTNTFCVPVSGGVSCRTQ